MKYEGYVDGAYSLRSIGRPVHGLWVCRNGCRLSKDMARGFLPSPAPGGIKKMKYELVRMKAINKPGARHSPWAGRARRERKDTDYGPTVPNLTRAFGPRPRANPFK